MAGFRCSREDRSGRGHRRTSAYFVDTAAGDQIDPEMMPVVQDDLPVSHRSIEHDVPRLPCKLEQCAAGDGLGSPHRNEGMSAPPYPHCSGKNAARIGNLLSGVLYPEPAHVSPNRSDRAGVVEFRGNFASAGTAQTDDRPFPKF